MLSSVKGMRGRKSSGPTEEDLKIKRLALFFFQVDTTAADGLHGPSTNRGEEVKAFSAF